MSTIPRSMPDQLEPIAEAPATGTQPAQAAKRRSLTIDMVRGIAISLVALGHTNQGLLHRGWWGSSPFGLRLDLAIYSFHMPAFFFVSGLFLIASVEKRGLVSFFQNKLSTMIWPYLVSCVVGTLVLVFSGAFTSQRVRPIGEWIRGVVTGEMSWFLPTLFLSVMIGAIFRRVPKPLLFLAALVVGAYPFYIPIAFIRSGLRFLPFLVLGMWAGPSVADLEKLPRWLALLGAGAAAVCIVWVTYRATADTWLFVPLGVLGTLMLLLISQSIRHSFLAIPLSRIGEASFGVFLLSEYPQGFFRELLLRGFHVTHPLVQLLVPSFFAIVLPVWVYQHRYRLHLGWMFLFPSRKHAA